MDKASLLNDIGDIAHMGMYTNMSGGLRQVVTDQFTPQNGDRPGVPNVAIVLASSASNVDDSRTVADAEMAYFRGVSIVGVGITQDVSEHVIRAISAKPQQENSNYFMVDHFLSLYSLRDTIGRALCKQTGVYYTNMDL